MRPRVIAAMVTVALTLALPARAWEVLTFDELDGLTSHIIEIGTETFDTQGFHFTFSAFPSRTGSFTIFKCPDPCPHTESPAYYQSFSAFLSMTRLDGQAFSIASLRAASSFSPSSGGDMKLFVSGLRADGTGVGKDFFKPDTENFFTTFAMPSTFVNLTSVGFSAGVHFFDSGIALDDIVYELAAPQVPLPAGMWLLLSGLGGCVAITRRRARTARI